MMEHNLITGDIVNAAYQVHRQLGPGLFEAVYEIALEHELKKQELQVDPQRAMPVIYDGISFDIGFKADMIINKKVIVELKSVETVLPVHKKQLLTYLRLSDMRLGLLLNFGANLIKDGIFRMANKL